MTDSAFVSRGGLKLNHALTTFGFNVQDLICADFGCNVGGFTDCLLKHGAKKVFAIDTGYGELAWSLRQDNRVVTMERTNAIHIETPEVVDVVVIDLGWTTQSLALPAAKRWLQGGHIITLIKPHYELTAKEKHAESVSSGLSEEAIQKTIQRVKEKCEVLGLTILGETESPIRGKKSSKKGSGNKEFLMLLKAVS